MGVQSGWGGAKPKELVGYSFDDEALLFTWPLLERNIWAREAGLARVIRSTMCICRGKKITGEDKNYRADKVMISSLGAATPVGTTNQHTLSLCIKLDGICWVAKKGMDCWNRRLNRRGIACFFLAGGQVFLSVLSNTV